jgi:hypothetical protein
MRGDAQMKVVLRVGIGLGAIALFAIVFALAAPKAVNALVATLVRDIDNPGRATLVVVSCDASSTSGTNGDIGCLPSYTVPAGDRLVIQHLETTCDTPKGNSLVFPSLSLTTAGNPVSHSLVLANQGMDVLAFSVPSDGFVGNQAVTYYADPSSTLRFDVYITDASGHTGCQFQVSGYLISFP